MAALLLSITCACLANPLACGLALLIAVIALCVSSVSWREMLKRLAAVNTFVLFIWLTAPWMTPGETIWQCGFIAASKQGLDLTLLVTLKANAIACFFTSLAAPLSISSLASALRGLMVPEKLVWILMHMGGSLHVLGDEWTRLTEAAKLRGFTASASPTTYRTIASCLAILLIRAHERAQRIREAMLLRGFEGRIPQFMELHYTFVDFVFGCLVLVIVSLISTLELGLIRL